MIQELLTSIITLPDFHMWTVYALITGAVYLYATEKLPLEVTSIIVLVVLMMLFEVIPMKTPDGVMDADLLLQGFSNPALIAVLALLVMGQAVVRTGALTPVSNAIIRLSKFSPFLGIITTLIVVAVVSALVNNTPTVVIFIPIMLALAATLKISASKVMIPLSYASILGGTTVLIGSSTNLLVSAAIEPLGLDPLGFFDFTLPGVVIAAVGMVYIVFVLPRLLPNRAPLAESFSGGAKQFVAQLRIAPTAESIGKSITDEHLFGEEEVTIKMLQRGEHAYLPPFDDSIRVQTDDVIIITANRDTIKTLLDRKEDSMLRTQTGAFRDADENEKSSQTNLTELLITPGSKLIGQSIEQIGFHHNYQCFVLGIQRKARMVTSRMTEIRLAAGDVLLVMGTQDQMSKLRESKDMVVMEWSTEELPSKKYALRVLGIFGGAIALSIAGVVPIHLSAFLGVMLVILSGCINWRQALRAIDASIILLVAAGLAMSVALQQTGGALYLAHNIISLTDGLAPVFVMSAMFGLMAILTNVLSNNATALIFTPIAVNTALGLGVPPEMFIFAVIFASNCCALASPIGYQTNLLVMGPGHHVFRDFMKGGIPLVILVWITYTAYAYIMF